MAACMRNVTFLSRSFGKSCIQNGSCRHTPGFSRSLHSGHLRLRYSQRQKTFFLKHNLKCIQHGSARCASTRPDNLPFGYEPDVPTAVVDIKSMLPELNAIGEPTLQSMGLGGYSPVGMVQQCIEMLHVGADVPWWGAIALTALVVRLISFPVTVYGRKKMIKLQNHLPTVKRLQQKVSDSKAREDKTEWMRRQRDLNDYMTRNDVKMRFLFLQPAVQMPIFLSVYMAIRKMSMLPIESMKTGGALWFKDLTIADPYALLPTITALSLFAMVELGAESQKASEASHSVKWFMRCTPILVFAFTYKFASGIALYWTVSNVFSLAVAQMLKVQAVKNLFGIPNDVPVQKQNTEQKGLVEGFKDMYADMKLQGEAQKRRHVEEVAFRKAGLGPVPTTYKHNPMKNVDKKKKATSQN